MRVGHFLKVISAQTRWKNQFNTDNIWAYTPTHRIRQNSEDDEDEEQVLQSREERPDKQLSRTRGRIVVECNQSSF